MNPFERSAGHQLLKTASLVDFTVGEPVIRLCTDQENIFLEVELILGGDDEEADPADVVEWAAFGLIFALAVLSFFAASSYSFCSHCQINCTIKTQI